MRKVSFYIKKYVKFLALSAGVLTSFSSYSQTVDMEISDFFFSPDSSRVNNFAADIDFNGDYALVGARKDKTDSNGNTFSYEKGSAFLYKKNSTGGWELIQKLVANNPFNRTWFGNTVRISDNYIVVSTNGNRSMYVFEKDNSGIWVETQEIENTFNVSSTGDIQISGDIIAVGDGQARNTPSSHSGFDPGNGHVFIYEKTNGVWGITDTLSASDPYGNDHFGESFQLDGNRIIIGAPNKFHDYQGSNQINQVGAVYSFERDVNGNWVETQKLTPTVPGHQDRFGRKVALSGDHLLVGTYFEDEDANENNTLAEAGSVYFYHFENGQWTLVNKAVNSDRATYDKFGFSLDIEGDKAIIAAIGTDNGIEIPNKTTVQIETGSAYIFEYDGNTWNETTKVVSDKMSTQSGFGNNVRIDNNSIYITSNNHASDVENFKRTLVYHGSLSEPYLVNVGVGDENKLVTSDRDKWDDFGYAVAISGDWAIAGAPREDHDATGTNYTAVAGSAYLFQKNNNGEWIEMQKIVSDDRDVRDYFGHSVSIDGDYAVVGGYNRVDNQDGAAYVFKRNADDTWSQMQKLTRTNNATTSNFYAWDVSISGDKIFVGAPEESVTVGGQTYTSAGKVYVYELDASSSWVEFATLTSNDVETGDRFGYSIDVDGTTAIIGAYFEDLVNTPNNTNDAGAAYIFDRDGAGNWNQTQKISSTNPHFADYFGYDVALHNNTAVIGSFGEDYDLTQSNYMERAGTAFVFKKINGTWTKTDQLLANDREENDRYGSSVAIYGNHILVGAFADGDPSSSTSTMWNRAGAAYLYEEGTNNSWYFVDKITSSIRHEDDNFGNSVALSNSTILIGAPFESQDELNGDTKTSAGAIYFFDMIPNSTGSAKRTLVEAETESTVLNSSESILVSLYPNPVSNLLNIKLDEQIEQISIDVINLNGQIVEHINASDKMNLQLDLQHLPTGIYFVKLNINNKTTVAKIVKN